VSSRWSLLPALAIMALVLPVIAAHVPLLEEGGGDLADATVIEEPTKSWVIYTEYAGPEAVDYYRLSMRQGEDIVLMLGVPAEDGERGFAPDIALMGPGLGEDDVPADVQRPEGGAVVREGEVPAGLAYEPFTPGVLYEVAEIVVPAPEDGDYYVAVFDQDGAGQYSLAVGRRETFTVAEWLTVPLYLLQIYRWEGQAWWAIALPGAATFLAGLGLMAGDARRRSRRPDVLWLTVTVSGLLMLASGVTVGYQMVSKLLQVGELDPATALTAVFVIAPLLLGMAALRVARRTAGPSGMGLRSRGVLLLIGLLGLLSWSGWLLGPTLAILAAVVPWGWLDRRR